MSSYSDHRLEHETRAELREAYERGRRDARASRRRHPIIMTILVVAAIVGLAVLALALINGSFRDAGSVVDQNLSVAADKAGPAVQSAAADASQAVRDATSKDGTEAPAQPR